MDTANTNKPVLVWDLPVRLFHWMLVASFAGAWLTAESERWRDVHILLGYTAFVLIAFRIVWGFIGSRHARFADFAAGPSRVAKYLVSLVRPAPERHIGHNPAGGWAIFALLGLMLLTVITGYMNYEGLGGRSLEDIHEVAANALMFVAAVHVAGVMVSSFLHRENLIRSMITGMKNGLASDGISRPRRIAAAVLLVMVTGFWVLALRGDLPAIYPPEGTIQSAARTQSHSDND